MAKRLGIYLIAALILAATYFLGVAKGYYGRISFENYTNVFKQELRGAKLGSSDLNLLFSVAELVKEKYIGEINYSNMLYGAIKGAVAALGDPYSVFTDPSENRNFFNSLDGRYEGIGIELDLVEDRVLIIAPLKDTPAAKVDIQPRDEILAVNGESVAGMTLEQVIGKIKGPAGTTVTLILARDGRSEPFEVSVVRSVIKQKSVSQTIEGNIGIITITRFGNDTETGFKAAVNELIGSGVKGVVIDLRSNPGGFLDAGVKVANEFIKAGLIVEERFKNGDTTPFYADGAGRMTDLPVVVLVNKGSASAAEIVAGALQDNKRGTIVGEQTFGKGSVQEVEAFKDGSALRLTVAKWYTPGGRSISDAGIKPDKEVVWDGKPDSDNQLTTAKEVLKGMMK